MKRSALLPKRDSLPDAPVFNKKDKNEPETSKVGMQRGLALPILVGEDAFTE
jgi:hypothetical protein